LSVVATLDDEAARGIVNAGLEVRDVIEAVKADQREVPSLTAVFDLRCQLDAVEAPRRTLGIGEHGAGRDSRARNEHPRFGKDRRSDQRELKVAPLRLIRDQRAHRPDAARFGIGGEEREVARGE
jgi:hypothetical protein